MGYKDALLKSVDSEELHSTPPHTSTDSSSHSGGGGKRGGGRRGRGRRGVKGGGRGGEVTDDEKVADPLKQQKDEMMKVHVHMYV